MQSDPPTEEAFQTDFDDVIKNLASQVNNLSLAEREAGLFDIHGISPIEQETEEADRSRSQQTGQAPPATGRCEAADRRTG